MGGFKMKTMKTDLYHGEWRYMVNTMIISNYDIRVLSPLKI